MARGDGCRRAKPPRSAILRYSIDPEENPLRFALFPILFRPANFKSSISKLMSQHRSLKSSSSAVGAKRSVLKRGERIKLLKARGLWKEGRAYTNLPKTKPAA
jgi:small basic protein (TIGR04137 family)